MQAINGFSRLTDWGVIAARGDEAAHFLHHQLTQDLLLIKPNEARFAGYCSPKGRLLANFIAIKPDAHTVLLVCPQDLLPATLKRLSMFVLRAKVTLTDATSAHTLIGLMGDAARAAMAAGGLAGDAAPWSHGVVGTDSAAHVVTLYPAVTPAGSVPLALWLAPSSAALPADASTELPLATWQWAQVMSGVVWVNDATVDRFVPQMLNHESVGGVNFKKGCYPGQEVVARSQFRGTTKRRTLPVTSRSALAAGQEVFAEGDAEQPVGVVAQAAAAPDGTGVWHALACLQTAALESGDSGAGALLAGGARLQVGVLPYALAADI